MGIQNMDFDMLFEKFRLNKLTICYFFYMFFHSACSYATENQSLELNCYYNFDYQSTIQNCTNLIKLNNNNSKAYYNRGRSNYFLQNYPNAILDLSQSLILDPNNTNAYTLRADAKDSLKDFRGAILDYTRAIELNPNDLNIYWHRGESKLELEDFRGALEDFQQVLVLDPNKFLVLKDIGYAKYRLKEYSDAIEMFDIVISYLQNVLATPLDLSNSNLDEKTKQHIIEANSELSNLTKNDLAEALYFRGLCKIILQLKDEGCIDLSTAGQLGYQKAYTIIKKSCD